MKKWDTHAELVNFGRQINLHLCQVNTLNNTRAIARSLVMETINDDDSLLGSVPEPLLTLRMEEAQRLIDQLWHCGLRPSEGSGSAGSLAATERHLRDMQAIAKGALAALKVET